MSTNKKHPYAKIYAPLLYIAGWYTSSQLNAMKQTMADGAQGNSSSAIASFVVLLTISAVLILKATNALSDKSEDESVQNR